METLYKIHSLRPDLSEYVFHFTKGKDAAKSLDSILSDRKIKDKKGRGFLCFTEAPLLALVDMFSFFAKYPGPLYAPFGVAVLKSQFFRSGGRNVIYGPESEKTLIDESIHWRYEKYDEQRNFTWLREWRIQKPEYEINPQENFIITGTKEWEDVNTFEDVDIESESYEVDGYFGRYYEKEYSLQRDRIWKSISIESLMEHSFKSKDELYKYIDSQKVGESKYVIFDDQDPRAEKIREDLKNERLYDQYKHDPDNYDSEHSSLPWS